MHPVMGALHYLRIPRDNTRPHENMVTQSNSNIHSNTRYAVRELSHQPPPIDADVTPGVSEWVSGWEGERVSASVGEWVSG